MLKVLKNPLTFLALILILGFAVRLYRIDSPVADWHSWRQADTAAVSRNFYKQSLPTPDGEGKEGYNPLIPRYDDMSGVAENPVINPERYRFVEFPIANSLTYLAYLINGGVDERLARLVSILFSLGSTIFVYLLAKKYFGVINGLLSAFIFAFLPFNIFFSRVILPEPALVFFSLGMLYYLDLWIKLNTKSSFILGFVFTVLAFLTKPVAVFYLIPLVHSYYIKEGKFWPIPKRYFYILPAFLPFIGWRLWINQHPEGIPGSKWLLNGNQIRFKPAFWRWIIEDRFGRELLGTSGTFMFLVGILRRPLDNQSWLLHLLGFSSLLFLIVFATGNVQHDYYQTLIIPAVAIFSARGFLSLISGIPGFLPKLVTAPIAVLSLFLVFFLGWGEIKGFYQINNPAIVEAGLEADKILPKDAKVIAPLNGDTSFLYQTNRAGFPSVPLPIPELVTKYGITHYVSTAKDAKTKWVMRNYEVIKETENYVIADLTKPKPATSSATLDPEPSQ